MTRESNDYTSENKEPLKKLYASISFDWDKIWHTSVENNHISQNHNAYGTMLMYVLKQEHGSRQLGEIILRKRIRESDIYTHYGEMEYRETIQHVERISGVNLETYTAHTLNVSSQNHGYVENIIVRNAANHIFPEAEASMSAVVLRRGHSDTRNI